MQNYAHTHTHILVLNAGHLSKHPGVHSLISSSQQIYGVGTITIAILKQRKQTYTCGKIASKSVSKNLHLVRCLTPNLLFSATMQ